MCLVSHVILNISAYLLNVCWDTRYGTRCQLFQNYLQMQKFNMVEIGEIFGFCVKKLDFQIKNKYSFKFSVAFGDGSQVLGPGGA